MNIRKIKTAVQTVALTAAVALTPVMDALARDRATVNAAGQTPQGVETASTWMTQLANWAQGNFVDILIAIGLVWGYIAFGGDGRAGSVGPGARWVIGGFVVGGIAAFLLT